ncbi:MAG: hypothetical protein HC837_08430, partial [Chloroflexaceae bacterium]|nr:hypothetical protein [Chloroflexaceae bacterium]
NTHHGERPDGDQYDGERSTATHTAVSGPTATNTPDPETETRVEVVFLPLIAR